MYSSARALFISRVVVVSLLLCSQLWPQAAASNDVAPSTTQAAPATAPPQLASISEQYASGLLSVTFLFDSSVRDYTQSTYTIRIQRDGAWTDSATTPVTLDGARQNAITVPIDLTSVSGDKLGVKVALQKIAGTSVATTPEVERDLKIVDVLKQFQTTINDNKLKMDTQNQQIATLQAQVQALRTRKTQLTPSYVKLTKPILVSDNQIILEFATDKYGQISVNNIDSTQEPVITQIGRDHIAVFNKLAPDTDYRFDAVALDASGNAIESTRIDSNKDPNLKQKTLPALLTFAPSLEASPKSDSVIEVSVNLNPSNLQHAPAGCVQIEYKQVLVRGTTQFDLPKYSGQCPLDQFGLPSGTLFSGIQKARLEQLHANTDYMISLHSIDQYGRKYDSPDVEVTTKETPTPFAFDGPLNVSIDPVKGFLLTWRATNPVKEAKLHVHIGQWTLDRDAVIDTKDTHSITVSTDLNGFVQVLNQFEQSKNTPAIEVEMTNADAAKLTEEVAIQFVLSKTSSDSKPQAGQQKEIADAVGNLYKASQDPKKKIAWRDVVTTGLGILVKLL